MSRLQPQPHLAGCSDDNPSLTFPARGGRDSAGSGRGYSVAGIAASLTRCYSTNTGCRSISTSSKIPTFTRSSCVHVRSATESRFATPENANRFTGGINNPILPHPGLFIADKLLFDVLACRRRRQDLYDEIRPVPIFWGHSQPYGLSVNTSTAIPVYVLCWWAQPTLRIRFAMGGTAPAFSASSQAPMASVGALSSPGAKRKKSLKPQYL